MYKNILNIQMNQFNQLYKSMHKNHPSWSIEKKRSASLQEMLDVRGVGNAFTMLNVCANPFVKEYQYVFEVAAVSEEISNGIDRYYVKDDSLFDFFRMTEVRQKEIISILETLDCEENGMMWGVLGQSYSCVILYTKTPNGLHIITIFDDTLNQTFCVEECKDKNNAYNFALNFLFYIKAFPECVLDGVPNGVKRNTKAKSISISDKIVSHSTVERGFVRPHFRSGYFRHFNSDYFVNCKGQVRFIASTMVKGKAYTVINKE